MFPFGAHLICLSLWLIPTLFLVIFVKKRFQKLLTLKKILRQLLTPHTSIAVNTGKDNPGHSQAPSNLVKAIVK